MMLRHNQNAGKKNLGLCVLFIPDYLRAEESLVASHELKQMQIPRLGRESIRPVLARDDNLGGRGMHLSFSASNRMLRSISQALRKPASALRRT